jgi:signal transduction histidine kinase
MPLVQLIPAMKFAILSANACKHSMAASVFGTEVETMIRLTPVVFLLSQLLTSAQDSISNREETAESAQSPTELAQCATSNGDAEDWVRELTANARTLDENLPECVRLCTSTIRRAQLVGDDAAVATALMQRSAARSSLSGAEDSVEDFQLALKLLPLSSGTDLQCLFTQALVHRQRFLGAKQTALIAMTLGAEDLSDSCAGDPEILVRLMCDILMCRAEEGRLPSHLVQRSLALLPLTQSRELQTRFTFVHMTCGFRRNHPDEISDLLVPLEAMLRQETFHRLSRGLRIEIRLLAAQLYHASGSTVDAARLLQEAENDARQLANQTLIAACLTKAFEFSADEASWPSLQRNMEQLSVLIPVINCPDLLRSLCDSATRLPLNGAASDARSTFRKRLEDRLEHVEQTATQSSHAVSQWASGRVREILAFKSRQISQEKTRADTAGRRSLIVTRVGSVALVLLSIVLLRDQWRLRRANQRLQEEIRNTERQRQDKERMELYLAQSERLESLGELAGGIAHDFNNLLVGVIGNADLLRHCRDFSPSELKYLNGIVNSAEAAAGLSRKMLAYAGKQPAVKRIIDLNDSVRKLLPLLQAGLGTQHEIDFLPASQTLLFEGDPAQLDQVLLNLVNNAAQAMENRVGHILIQTGCSHLETIPADVPTFGNRKTGGQFVWFEVSDNGRGVPESELARIFEPFYTTRGKSSEREKSTRHGFGLAVVYGHVNRHHGLIQLSSIVGHGTSFRILLPQTPTPVENAALPTRSPSPQFHMGQRPSDQYQPHQSDVASGQVVVVDACSESRDSIQHALRSAGFRVEPFGCETDALEFLVENTGIHCLLLGTGTEVLNIPAILEELTNRGIQVPVLLMIDGSSENLPKYQQVSGIYSLLVKPFSSVQLIAAVDEAAQTSKGRSCQQTAQSVVIQG